MTTASRQPFGTTHHGQPVELLTLDNGTLSCQIITFRAPYVPSGYRTGPEGLWTWSWGTRCLKEYQDQDGYLGAVVGRFANRITRRQVFPEWPGIYPWQSTMAPTTCMVVSRVSPIRYGLWRS